MVLNKLIMVFHLKCIFLLAQLLFVVVFLLLRRRGERQRTRVENRPFLSHFGAPPEPPPPSWGVRQQLLRCFHLPVPQKQLAPSNDEFPGHGDAVFGFEENFLLEHYVEPLRLKISLRSWGNTENNILSCFHSSVAVSQMLRSCSVPHPVL